MLLGKGFTVVMFLVTLCITTIGLSVAKISGNGQAACISVAGLTLLVFYMTHYLGAYIQMAAKSIVDSLEKTMDEYQGAPNDD